MGYVTTPSTFFIPGEKGLSKADAAFLDKHYPAARKTQGGIFLHDEIRTNYYIAQAAKEKAVVIGAAGLNSQYILNPREVEKLNAQGITFVWISLPRAKPGKTFMAGYESLCRAFLTDYRSPSYALTSNDVPHYIATHSTAGAIVLKLLHEDTTNKKLRTIFSGAAYSAPFLDVPFASRDHSFRIGSRRPLFWAFEKYSSMHANERVVDLPIVKRYLALTAKKEAFSEHSAELSPTFGQIREIQAYSRAMMDNFDGHKAGALNAMIMAGDRDPFTCYKTTSAIARKMGADFYLAHGAGHDPIKDQPELLQKFVQKLDECVANEQEKKEAKDMPSYIVRDLYQSLDIASLLPLRDRARLALQSRAGTLNAAAGFLQRFG